MAPFSPSSPGATRSNQLALIVAALSVGLAIKINGGNYHPAAIALVAVALLAGLIAVSNFRLAILERLSPRSIGAVIAIALIAQVVALLTNRLVPPSQDAESPEWLYRLLIACAVAAACCLLPFPNLSSTMLRRIAAAAMPIALVLHFAVNVAAIRAALYPVMDVLVFQELSAEQLINGGNPYAMQFPDLSHGTSPHYGPGLQKDNLLLFGFPYPPLSLFWLLPFTFATLQVQYAHALAFTAAAALIAYTTRGPIAKGAAGLFMLMPIGPLVIASGWTEPLVVLMLALTVFLACRCKRRPHDEPRTGSRDRKGAGKARAANQPLPHGRGSSAHFLGIGLGLLWSAKQYVPLTAPLALLLTDGPARRKDLGRLLISAVATGLLVSLPLVLWDIPAFWHSAVAVQFLQPFREEALSFLALAYRWTGVAPPAWIAFIALFGVQALALWRSPRTPAGFAAAVAASLLAFFAFNKQAFANYYFLVVGAFACALAATEQPE